MDAATKPTFGGKRDEVAGYADMMLKPSPPLLMLRRLVRSVEKHGVRASMMRSWRRLVSSLTNHGIRGTFSRAFVTAPNRSVPVAPCPEHPFDRRYGTDTGGYISGAELEGTSLSAIYSTAYYGIPPSTLEYALGLLDQQERGTEYPKEFTFVDLGSGKGRALLVASRCEFRAIVGVELVADLCRFAMMNSAVFPGVNGRITVQMHDATTVAYSDGPLLVFLFHPFLKTVLRRVLANLEKQLRKTPRVCFLLYAFDPEGGVVTGESNFFEQVWDLPIPLSDEDAAVDELGQGFYRYTLYKAKV